MTESPDTNQSVKNGSVFFFGSSSFSLPILKALLRSVGRYRLAVVTTTPQPAGRGLREHPTPVAVEARTQELWLIEVKTLSDSELRAAIEDCGPLIGVSASFGLIFPHSIIEAFPRGIINVHPSLLPRHRGPSPVQWTIHEGDGETGVTLLLIDEQVDHGPILSQERVAVPPNATTPALIDMLARLGGGLLERTLPPYLNGTIVPKPQEETLATKTPLLTRDTGRINWATDDAAQIERHIRAFTPWPGVWTTMEVRGQLRRSPTQGRGDRSPDPRGASGKSEVSVRRVMKILKADPRTVIPSRAEGSRHDQTPGTISFTDGRLTIKTIHGLLYPTHLQLEGGKPMDIQSFLHGQPKFVGSQLH